MGSYIYNRGDDIVKIEILDGTGRKIDKFVFNLGNTTLKSKIAYIMKKKYGFFPQPEISEENSVSAMNAEKENDKEKNRMDWLGFTDDYI